MLTESWHLGLFSSSHSPSPICSHLFSFLFPSLTFLSSLFSLILSPPFVGPFDSLFLFRLPCNHVIDTFPEKVSCGLLMNQGTRAAQISPPPEGDLLRACTDSHPPDGVCCMRVPGFMRRSTTQGPCSRRREIRARWRPLGPPLYGGGGHQNSKKTDRHIRVFNYYDYLDVE